MRFDPFAELSRLQDDMTRMFAPTHAPTHARETRGCFQPAVDIFEEKDAIVVLAELPGVKSEDLHITVENDLLSIAGERKLDRREGRGEWHRIESTYGAFARSFALPKTVSPEQIEANLDGGVLTVRLPKRQEAKPRKIEIKAGEVARQIEARA